jgi:hypothetical protein
VRVAETTGYVEVPDSKYQDCPLSHERR